MDKLQNDAKKGFITNRTLWLAIGCILIIAGISYAALSTKINDNPISDMPLYEVKEGPLTVSVAVAGTIQAREKTIIKNELEGSSTILYLIPEGQHVKKGDLLVELDASSLIDQRVDQQISVQNAEASYINSRENLAIVESQAKSDIDEAKLAYEFAVMDLDKYINAEYPQSEKTALNNITKMEQELKLAEEELRWSKILFDEKYIAESKLQGDELAVSSLKLSLDVNKTDLDMLQNYTYKRQIAQLESDVEQAKMSLDRTERQAKANIVQASADMQAKEAEFLQQKSKLEKLDDQISKAKIYAPMDGLVIYHTSVEMNWRGNQEPLEEGQSVRERQELIHLPTTSSYIAEVKVRESSFEKIRVGLPVRITVDAVPGKEFVGKIANIAPLPNAQSVFMNPDLKEYDTVIVIEGEGEELRSGMGCQAEIIVDYFENTTYVPVQSVIRIGNQPSVFVVEDNAFKPRPIVLGPDNNRLAQVESGIEKGEMVMLTPPLSYGQVSDDERFNNTFNVQSIMEDAENIETPEINISEAPSEPGQGFGRGQGQGQQGQGQQGQGQQGQGQFDGQERSGERMRGQGRPGGERGQGFDRGQGGRGARPDFGNMTQEQRDQMRQRFENMSQEERDNMRQRFQNRDENAPQQSQQSEEPQPPQQSEQPQAGGAPVQ